MAAIESALHDVEAPANSQAQVNLQHLRHNAGVLKQRAENAEILAVVKANAYGHGMLPVVETLCEAGVRRFAVAVLTEAIQLRNAGITDQIVVFASPIPEHIPLYAEYQLDVAIPSRAVAEAVVSAVRTSGPIRVQVVVDTGMGRVGERPEVAIEIVRMLERTPGIHIAGIWTHFAVADEPENPFTAEQLERFLQVVKVVGDAAENLHAANSAGLLLHPDSYRSLPRPLVRPGLALYGMNDWPVPSPPIDLRPVMRFTSRVVHLKTVPPGTTVSYGRRWTADKPSRIATVSAGYADGYPRLVSNRASVGIRGHRYPQVGSVCMDMLMVNLGDPDGPGADVAIDDEVVLFGEGGPSANEMAHWAETIPYEICCGVSVRVPRVYIP